MREDFVWRSYFERGCEKCGNDYVERLEQEAELVFDNKPI